MFRFKPVDLSRKKIKKNTISKRKALKWAKAQCIFDWVQNLSLLLIIFYMLACNLWQFSFPRNVMYREARVFSVKLSLFFNGPYPWLFIEADIAIPNKKMVQLWRKTLIFMIHHWRHFIVSQSEAPKTNKKLWL